jgi:hypothetical protein
MNDRNTQREVTDANLQQWVSPPSVSSNQWVPPPSAAVTAPNAGPAPRSTGRKRLLLPVLAGLIAVGLAAYGASRVWPPAPEDFPSVVIQPKGAESPDPQPEPKDKPEPKDEPTPKPQPEPKDEPKLAPKPEPEPAPAPRPAPQAKPEDKKPEPKVARKDNLKKDRREAPATPRLRLKRICAVSGGLAGPGCPEPEERRVASGRLSSCAEHPQLRVGARWRRAPGGYIVTVLARNTGGTVEKGSITISAQSNTLVELEPLKYPDGWRPEAWKPGDKVAFLPDERSNAIVREPAKTYGAEACFSDAPWRAGERRSVQFMLRTRGATKPPLFVRCTADVGGAADRLGQRFYSATGNGSDPQGWPSKGFQLP